MSDNLLKKLRGLWQARRNEVDAQYTRTLSFGDYVVDRWEKAHALGFGNGTSIYDSTLVFGDVKVAENTWIGPFCVLDGTGGLTIGSYCAISAGVQIYSHDTVKWSISGGSAPYDYAPTMIGDRCYIGPATIVAKGVTLGDGCVIGAQSLVMQDVPAGAKAYGSPCRVVGKVDDGA